MIACVQVVKYWPEKGKSGFNVWRYQFRRDDPIPPPWSKEGKKRSEELGLEIQVLEGLLAISIKLGTSSLWMHAPYETALLLLSSPSSSSSSSSSKKTSVIWILFVQLSNLYQLVLSSVSSVLLTTLSSFTFVFRSHVMHYFSTPKDTWRARLRKKR